jgi:hypothetical protein
MTWTNIATATPVLTPEVEFLLAAANYTGNADAPYSQAARDAVDALVEKMRESAELVYEQLVIDRRRYNKMRAEDPDNERVGAGN